MATGGIFQLITNDGRQDRLLMASQFLSSQLNNIKIKRARQNLDPTPTISDIEQTHILFTSAHFKPFAAMAYEYNKVYANSGSPTLGSDVQFSIPQFGDFFHDMVLHVVLGQPTLSFSASPISDQPLIRWCDYPGERLCKKTRFEVNGNPLDEYTSDAYNFYRTYCVPPQKLAGWKRCMGQEESVKGYVEQPNWANSDYDPEDITHRVATEVYEGLQTPTGSKDGNVELMIPLLFWFNKDPRLAIASVAIPYGQRFINVTLASGPELVGLVPRGAGTWSNPGGTLTVPTVNTLELYINNIFVNKEVHDIFIKRVGFTLIRVHRQQTMTCNKDSDSILMNSLKWPTETLFLAMKIADYNSTSAATQRQHLDKWHTFCTTNIEDRAELGWTVNKEGTGSNITGGTADTIASGGAVVTYTWTGSVNLNPGLKTGSRLLYVSGATAAVVPGTVHTITSAVVDSTTPNTTVFTIAPPLTNGAGSPTDTANAVFRDITGVNKNSKVFKQYKTLETLQVKAHGIPIYTQLPTLFHNAYVPFRYGGHNVNTPEDIGACMINFCLYPQSYQPSGHVNISRAREFYIEYTTPQNTIGYNGITGTFVVVASAINFLLLSDGSAVLRYST